MELRMTTRGIDQALKKLDRAQQVFAPGGALEKTLANGAQDIRTFVTGRFRAETAPDDMRWAPLADSTIEARERNLLLGRARGAGSGWVVMTRTERQEVSKQRRLQKWGPKGAVKKGAESKLKKHYARGGFKILNDSGRLFGSVRVWAQSRSIFFGSELLYLLFHQDGTKNMVARPVMPVENIGGKWQPIDRGSAGVMWAKIRADIAGLLK